MEDENKNTEKVEGQELENKNASKKIWAIIIVIIAVLAIAFFLGRRNLMAPGTKTEYGANGEYEFTMEDGTVTVTNTTLPDNWPADVPKYTNGVLQQAGSVDMPDGSGGVSALIISNESLSNIADFYNTELAKEGWEITKLTNGNTAIVSGMKDDRSAAVYIIDENGQRSISIGASL